MLRWLIASVLLVGGLSAGQVSPEAQKAVAPPAYSGENGGHFTYYAGPHFKILGAETLVVAMTGLRDYQSNGPTPTRLWALSSVYGIYAAYFNKGPSYLRWNFYDLTNSPGGFWVASDTGFRALEPAGYGNMCLNYFSNSYQYYPFFTGHSYVSEHQYYPDVWAPKPLSFGPFSWVETPDTSEVDTTDFWYYAGEVGNFIWPRIGFTQSGYLHQITTDYSSYNIYYDRINDIENPFWYGATPIVFSGDAPWYSFNTNPKYKTVVVNYCRQSSDNHIIMLVDTMEGDMFINGGFIELDLSDLLSSTDTLSVGFVGDGTPFIDKDGNVHSFLFGSDGTHVIPVHIWHFFYNPEADTMHWSPVVFIDNSTIQASVGYNTLAAGRAQLGQNLRTGNLYAIWEEFVIDSGRFVFSSPVNDSVDTFPPTMVMLGKSTDDGLSWEIETLAVSDVDFGNVWLRFPVISPVIPSQVTDTGDTVDAVIWGVHEDDDPGFAPFDQGVDTTQVLWVSVPTGKLIGVSESNVSPGKYVLKAWSVKNPVNDKAAISFQISREGKVSLSVFDLAGRRVKTLVNGVEEAGIHSVNWDLSDGMNRPVPSGVYFYVLKAFGETQSGKLVVTH